MKNHFVFLSLLLLFSVSPNSVSADTFMVTNSDGSAYSLTVAPRAYNTGDGKTEMRIPGTWTWSKGSLSLTNGVIYPLLWVNYEKQSSGTLNLNDPAQGAMMAIMYATKSSTCSDGALLMVFLEMPSASSVSSIGATLNLTPMSGFICGSQISSFNTSALSAVTSVNISGSTSTATTGSTGNFTPNSGNFTPGSGTFTVNSGSTSSNFSFTGSYKSQLDGTTMSLTQSGSSLTGTVTQSLFRLSISGTISGGAVSVNATSTGTGCTGSGSGKFFYMGENKVLADIKPSSSSTCGGALTGVFEKQ